MVLRDFKFCDSEYQDHRFFFCPSTGQRLYLKDDTDMMLVALWMSDAYNMIRNQQITLDMYENKTKRLEKKIKSLEDDIDKLEDELGCQKIIKRCLIKHITNKEMDND